MITVKTLKEILNQYPDEAELSAYEGEGIGLTVRLGDMYGWISTGDDDDKNPQKHELLKKF